MSSFKKSNEDQRKRGNFDSVPADDGFRNYMSRKIELQRKQFGLVVPPPPPPSHPRKPKPTPPKILKKAKRSQSINKKVEHNTPPTPRLTDNFSTNNDATPTRSEKKSVRFHQSLEVGGVSRVLNKLKRRQSIGRKRGSRSSSTYKRRRKLHSLTFDANQESLPDNIPNITHHDSPLSIGEGKPNFTNSSYTSVLGVLDNLQMKHGSSFSKRKRTSCVSDTSKKRRTQQVAIQTPLVEENDSIDSCVTGTLKDGTNATDITPLPKGTLLAEDSGSFASSLTGKLKDDNDMGHTTPSLKGRRDNVRCDVGSILEGLEPIIQDSISLKYESRQNARPLAKQPGNLPTSQNHHEEYLRHISEKSFQDSYDLFGSPIAQQSPSRDTQSPPTKKSQDALCSFSQNLDFEGSELQLISAESRTGTLPFMESSSSANIQILPQLSPADGTLSKQAQKSNHRPDLFLAGIVVLVNGHTSPDATTLMRLLHQHGGDLEKYETGRVTHIIAEQLSVAKANIYKRQKKPTPVCRPEWITDSVERGKLLPFGDYLLDDVRDDACSKSVKSFFTAKTAQNDIRPILIEIDNESPEEMESNRLALKTSPRRWSDTHLSKANYQVGEQVRTVGNDPNFLDSYFSNSRLSYIGSFKQRVKPTKKTSSHSQIKAGAKKFILLVDMDCFFAAVALRKYPQYRNKPVAVGHAHSAKLNSTASEISVKTYSKKSSSELSTCNYIARKHGIKKGMFLGDAIQLNPDLVVLPYDFKGFEEVTGIVADQLHGYADQYNGCVEQVSCDESYVEINIIPDDCPGNDVYDFVKILAEHIRADIVKKTDCTASIGIGPNKLLAKLAADKVKPNACCVVKDWREFLDDLSLRDIPGIGRKLQKKLKPHGLCTVNDIWDLDDDAEYVLGDIIGSGTARKIVQYCHGKDDRAVTAAIRKSIGAECNYGVRFDGPYDVDHMMQGLSKEVQKRMTGASVRGAKLVLKVMKSKDLSKVPGKFLGHGRCDSFSRSADIPLTRDKDVISSAAMKLYDRLGIDKKYVRGMGIVIGSLISDDEVDPLNSSPTKLSAWLIQDSTTPPNKEPQEVIEESQTSNQATFITKDDDAYETTTVKYSESGSPMMPTFSQLDQDVLHNLPDEILSEVKSMYGKNSGHQTLSASQSSLKSPIRTHTGKGKKSNKPIPIAGQTSVRRMLKLACIKSGEEHLGKNDVSLSQLDCLPLKVQLQIANDDEIEIAKRPKQKAKSMNVSLSLTHNQDDPIDADLLYGQSSQIEAQKQGSSDTVKHNFHRDNIAPLLQFISANPNPDSEIIETVKDFLTTCITEKRIDDVVIFLRSIKNMQDGWDRNIYSHLRESSYQNIHSTTGSQLDMKWLGL